MKFYRGRGYTSRAVRENSADRAREVRGSAPRRGRGGFLTPVTRHPGPAVAHTTPVPLHPHRVNRGSRRPVTGHPHIRLAVPTPIAGDPDVRLARRGAGVL